MNAEGFLKKAGEIRKDATLRMYRNLFCVQFAFAVLVAFSFAFGPADRVVLLMITLLCEVFWRFHSSLLIRLRRLEERMENDEKRRAKRSADPRAGKGQ